MEQTFTYQYTMSYVTSLRLIELQPITKLKFMESYAMRELDS
jgi:hypothetical protein